MNHTLFSSALCFTVEYMPLEPHCSIQLGALQWSICHMNHTVQFSVVLYSGVYAT